MLIHTDDRAQEQQAWRDAVQKGEPYHSEFRLRHRAGTYKWVLGRAQPERDAAGQITTWYGSCTDIEDIVQARQVLKRSRDELEAEVIARTGERNLLATIVETTDTMVMAVDLDFTILAVNKACAAAIQQLQGVSAAPGDNLLQLLSGQPEKRASLEACWRRALAGEESIIIETYEDLSRQPHHFEVKFRTLRNEAGERIGAFHFVEDITQRVNDQAMLAHAQEALLQSQKLDSIGQLTGGVAHDFNNLLTPIIGSLDILQRRGVGGEREQRLIHGAYQSAERAKILVQRLLAFARRQPLQSVPVDIGLLIRGIADLIGSTIGPQISLALAIEPDLPPAKADPSQLEMAILNLSVNSRDAMPMGGKLTISAARAAIDLGHIYHVQPGQYVRVAVTDTGIGMDEATRAKAIEPFFSTKGVGKGTGLGLSMAHGLASQLGGALTIESAPGAGTEVAIWLPESSLPVPRDQARISASADKLCAGIALVVDDEEYIRSTTVDMLTELGFEVHEAASGEAALARIDAGLKPDILITDHLMPGMTGEELAYALKARSPQSRIVIVSGFAEAAGIDPSLPRLNKPFVLSELVRLILACPEETQAL
jgi:PAS domain S-box-containing protein